MLRITHIFNFELTTAFIAFISLTFACLGSLVVWLQGIAIGGVPSTNIAGVVLEENEAQAERNPTTRLILGIPQTATFSKYMEVSEPESTDDTDSTDPAESENIEKKAG